MMAVARTTQVARRAEEAKASKASKPAAKEPKEAVEASAAKEPSAAEATSDPVEDSEPAKPVGFDITKQIGATPPLGFWDPAKLCKSEQQFREFRVAELKHGRVAMMAALGAVVQHFVTFPGFGNVPRGIEAPTDGLGGLGFLVLVGLSGYLESEVWKQDDKKEPGDFGDPLGIAEKVGKYDDEWRNREVNNGRFAMFAAMGIIVAENETGLDAVEQIFGV